ncbi:hypothetical protein QRB38_19985 [Mycobacterium avium subsp. hominissuis]|uniref:hypothetical protein n=1 Tax=Mycobacterium avium TaxID=1764 RepID=UPI002666E792|nr:hypothetical protein [Mycobacterium avium]MDO2396057.1 hypothetical protein [Mycobacterium avium subsp. hominissuis]
MSATVDIDVSSAVENRRAKLVAVTATGPIYLAPRASTVVRAASAFALYRELAQRAHDPKAEVVSSLAKRVRGKSADLAWVSQTLAASVGLVTLTPNQRVLFLRYVLKVFRQTGVYGNEPILAAAINAAWPWVPPASLPATLRVIHGLIEKSTYTDTHRCVVVDPNTRTVALLDPGQFKIDPVAWLDWRRIDGKDRWKLSDDRWELTGARDPYGVSPNDSAADGLGWRGGGSYTPGDFQGPGRYGGPGMGSGGYGWENAPGGWTGGGSYTPGDFQGPGRYGGPGMGSGGYGWEDSFSNSGFGSLGAQTPGSDGGPYGFGSYAGLGGASDFWGDAAVSIGGGLKVAGPVTTAAGVGIGSYGAGGLATGLFTVPSLGIEVTAGTLVVAGIGASFAGGFLENWGNRHNANESASKPAPSGSSAPAPAPTPAPSGQTITVPVVVIPVDDDDDDKDKPKPEKPKSGDLYPDPDGGGTVDPTKIWDGDSGGGTPTTIWDGDSGVGPASIWDENGGGGTPTTKGGEIEAPALAGPGLRVGVVQIAPGVFTF